MNAPAKANKKIAVLHVGPHKTGTTAIQSVTQIFVHSFRQDSYIVVDYDHDFIQSTSHHPTDNLALCNCPADTRPYLQCDKKLLDETKHKLHMLSPAYNILLSHEDMDRSCVDVAKVRSILYPKWDVKIIVAYRRFYQWIVSLYKQTHRTDIENTAHAKKSRVWPKIHTKNKKKDMVDDMISWLTHEKIKDLYDNVYSTAVYDRYSAIFDNVSILNMHNDGGDLVGSFICDQVPLATHACHNWKTNNIQPPRPNRAAVTFYDEIAQAAYFEGYISNGISREEARERIQQHQEQELNLTAEDFPMTCLKDDLVNLILDLSLEAEEKMVPEFFYSELGEAELRSEFELYPSANLCSVDYDELWKQDDWEEFLLSLGGNGKGDSKHFKDEFIEMEEEKWNEEEGEDLEDLNRHRHFRR